jgi:pyroglutamyl-peptidase
MNGEPVILLAGFEPFGGEISNPAMELLAALQGALVAGHRIATVLLPVTFDGAVRDIERALERERPALALGIGQAGGRARLSLERVALNLVDARIADNAGEQPIDVPVIAAAPDAYFTTLPAKAMLRAMIEREIPAELSLTAGTYVCNAMFFALLHYAATRWPTLRAGFLHVPFLPAQAARHPGAPSLDLATMHAGVLVALEAALTHRTDIAEPLGTLC